jgi:citrate lyase subunit beta/citryl-CoA lyase/(S)-citramalyl-CoA lyase
MTDPRIDLADARVALFTPGNRPERFAKAAATGADLLVLDLEDAVAPGEKEAARGALIALFASGPRAGLGPRQRRGLRVNNVHTPAGLADLAALAAARAAPEFLLLPKVESAFEVRLVAAHLPRVPLLCTIESVRGLIEAHAIATAAPEVRALGFGGVDFAGELRAELSWDSMLHARSTLVHAAAGARIGLFDVPALALEDLAGLREECRRAKALGFTGKIAIHPAQVAPIVEAFSPLPAEIERARRMVEAFDKGGGNAVEFDGRFLYFSA